MQKLSPFVEMEQKHRGVPIFMNVSSELNVYLKMEDICGILKNVLPKQFEEPDTVAMHSLRSLV